MPTQVQAAVVDALGAPFRLADLLLDDPRPDELVVRIEAVGLCHTDLAVQHGHLPTRFPAVLGHEGAGTVAQVGSAVTGVAVGDRVALSFASCGHCAHCLAGRRAHCVDTPARNLSGRRPDGTATLTDLDAVPVSGNFFGQSSFASHALVTAHDVVRLPDHLGDVPAHLVAPLGCGVQTGAGTVLRSLDVQPGQSVVITGSGAVGLSAVAGAAIAGATTVVAVDVVEARLDLARELGATHTVNSSGLSVRDLTKQLRAATRGGSDHTVDTTGIADVVTAAVQATLFGGKVACVGVPRPGTSIDLSLVAASGRTFVSAIEGDSVPQTFIPQLLDLHGSGRLPLERLVTTYRFDDLDQAVADTASGRTVKAVLLLPAGGDADGAPDFS